MGRRDEQWIDHRKVEFSVVGSWARSMSSTKTYLYKDVFSGDEMFSMCFPNVVVDDFLIELQGKMVAKNADGEIDVGCGGAFGGNSTEEALPEGCEVVCDVIETYHLQQCDMSKKEFKEYLTGYGKRIARHLKQENPERNPVYKAKMVDWVQKLYKMHSEVVLWIGESFDFENPSAMAIQFWKDDDASNTPYFYFIKDGLFLGYPGFGKQTNEN